MASAGQRDQAGVSAARGRWSNRKVAGVLLAGMALVALATLVYALATQGVRRDHDSGLPKNQPVNVPFILRFGLGVYVVVVVYYVVRSWNRRDAGGEGQTSAGRWSVPAIALVGLVLVVLVIQTSRENEPAETPASPGLVRAVPPEELEGLAFLPGDTDVAAAVHVAEIMPSKKGEVMMTGLLTLAANASGPGDVFGLVDLADVDHVVIGLNGARGPWRGTLVVQTKKAYDSVRIGKAFPTGAQSRRSAGAVYVVPGRKGMRGLLWCASPRTLVVVFAKGGQPDLDAVPLRPRMGKQRLPGPLAKLFEERPLGSGHPIWLVGRLPDAETFKPLLDWLPVGGLDHGLLEKVVSVRAGLRLEPPMTLNVDLEARDAAKADELEGYLRGQKVKGNRMEVRRKARDLWVSVQVKLEGNKGGKGLGRER
jgi:hypothetical protein